ncbi:unnamed protein product, partial [Heterosigma akashiwo]
GGVRPVAISTAWRRCGGKVLCDLYKEQWAKSLGSTQFAVGLPAGNEKLLKLAQVILESDDPDDPDPICLLQIDAKNAFNSCSRRSFLRLLHQEYPELEPYVRQWYGRPTPLIFGSHTIWSRQGTQQGDPFGMFLFCLGLCPVLDRILDRCPRASALASANDILLAVRASQLASTFQVSSEELNTYDLEVKMPKCLAFCPREGALQDAGLPEDLPISYEGLLHLGVPLGSHAFVDRELDRIARTTADLLEEIKALDDPQAAMLLLRMSATPKLNHLSRSMSLYSGPLIAHLVQHDARVADTFTQLLNLEELSDPQRAQIHLPIRMGGFGLLSAHFTQISGYFGSFFDCLQDVWLRAQSLNLMPGQDLLRQARPGYQRQISQALHQERLQQLKQAVPPPREQVRLRSLEGDAAGAWLSALPGEWGCRFSNENFMIVCRLRLGAEIPGLRQRTPLRCPCGTPVDSLADHFLLCRRGPQRTRRHAFLIQTLREIIASTGTAAYIDVEAHLSDNPLTAGTIAPGARMDLVVYPSDGGPVQWIDPTVICPITSSSNSYILTSRAAGTTCPLRDAEANKRRTYGAAANRAGAVLFPFAYDTFTRRGEEAKKFLAQLAR